jgi:hypothetical protein
MSGCKYRRRLVKKPGDEGGIKSQWSSPPTISLNSGDQERQEITYILKLLQSNLEN